MPPTNPHQPPSHHPDPGTDDGAPAANAATYRADVPGVDPDVVLRNIRRCNGFRSWSMAPREIYELADCTLSISEHIERAPELVVDGPDAEQIRSILARLGLPCDVAINQLQKADDS